MQIGGQDTTFGGMRNRIINGDMRIDQRYAGSSVLLTTGGYIIDRWYASVDASSKMTVGRNLNNITPPAGFTNYLGAQTTSAVTLTAAMTYNIIQWIEGYNVADLNLGTSSAVPFTVSFWVYSSLTGTFSGSVGGYNGSILRNYAFTYSIPVSNTWTKITVTIPPDTSSGFGYNTTNGSGLFVMFDMGSGSNFRGSGGAWTTAFSNYGVTGSVSPISNAGATFYITGVQLEKSSAATAFEYRQFGQELALCRRYYRKLGGGAGTPISSPGAQYQDANTLYFTYSADLTDMRTAPTPSFIGTAGTDYAVFNSTFAQQSGFTFGLASYTGSMGVQIQCTKSSHGLSNTPQIFFGAATTSGFLALSSEL
jgi:hypothetical protein